MKKAKRTRRAKSLQAPKPEIGYGGKLILTPPPQLKELGRPKARPPKLKKSPPPLAKDKA